MWVKEACFSLAAVAAGVALMGGFFYMPGYGSEEWPTVPGVVLGCEVVRRDGDDEVDYVAELRYRYTVGSMHHTGFRIAYWGVRTRFKWRSRAQAVCDGYPEGLPVTVWYEPAFPPNSALRPGGHPLGAPLTFGGAALTVLFLVGAVLATVVEGVAGHRERARLRRELGLDR